jgi:hypothetical protein
MQKSTTSLISVLGLLTASSSFAETEIQPTWHLFAGSGESHPGWGNTKEQVETRDLILRYQRPQQISRGSGWYENRRSVLIEAAYHHLESPDEPPMFGLYFLSCWTFEADKTLQPYLLVGGGGVYTQAEIPGTSSRLKGSYQAGIGLTWQLPQTAISLEYRFHHLSNGGIEEPNDPLNSDKLLLGLRLNM